MKEKYSSFDGTGKLIRNGKTLAEVDTYPRPVCIVRWTPFRWWNTAGSVYPLTRYTYSDDREALSRFVHATFRQA